MRMRRFVRPVLVALLATAAAVIAGPAPAQAAADRTACEGPLAFGEVVACPSISGDEPDVFTVTTTRADDTLRTMLTYGGESVSAEVTRANGDHVCFFWVYPSTCQLGPKGTYTISMSTAYGGEGTYTLSVESTRTPSACTALTNAFFSFASPGVTGDLPAGSAGDCYRFNQPEGTVLHLAHPRGSPDVQGTILDANDQPAGCSVRYTTECTLTGPPPYRLFVAEMYGTETSYHLRLPRLSQPAGCVATPLAPFGDPGANVGGGTLVQREEIGCHRLRTTAPGPVLIRVDEYQRAGWTVYDLAGQRICDAYTNARGCTLPAAGDYSLIMSNANDFGESVTYQVAAVALFRNTGCAAATSTAWTTPTILLNQVSPVQANCQRFNGKAGDRIVSYAEPTVYNSVQHWLVDSTGTELCTGYDEEDGCVLPADGTYRVVTRLLDWDPGTADDPYKLQVRRLSNPVGCPTVRPGAYNAPPAGAPAGVRCRILDVPSAGTYRVRPVTADNYPASGDVYTPAGLRVCRTEYCQFPAAGRYTMVIGGGAPGQVIEDDYIYATGFLPYVPSGCGPVTDSGAPFAGAFSTAGEVDCVQLPTPAGAMLTALRPGEAIRNGYPRVAVYDATGDQVCDQDSLRPYGCQLTGSAPYRAVFVAPDGQPAGPYGLAFLRTDGPPACTALSAGATGATVNTGADRYAFCFSIPADQHAARQAITFRRTAGTGVASMRVFNGSGFYACGTFLMEAERTLTCNLPAGSVTVLLETDAVTATYRVTHVAAP